MSTTEPRWDKRRRRYTVSCPHCRWMATSPIDTELEAAYNVHQPLCQGASTE